VAAAEPGAAADSFGNGRRTMSDQGMRPGVDYDAETGEVMETIGDTIRQALADEPTDVNEHLENHHQPVEQQGNGNGAPELPLNIPEHVAGESKAEAFVRLAEHRVSHALKRIDMIRHLSNRSAYDYSDSDVDLMLAELREAVDDVARSFRVNSPRREFRLHR
jgi:hypothetical protein